eukprot:SAG31_NODE_4865_length_2899_cov_8.739286_2_plen_92_part_00
MRLSSPGTLDHSCTEQVPLQEAGYCKCSNKTEDGVERLVLGPHIGCGKRKRMCKSACERLLGLDVKRRQWTEVAKDAPSVMTPAQVASQLT